MSVVGSVKANIVRELEKLVGQAGAHFVGSHLLVGSENNGVIAAAMNLFEHNLSLVEMGWGRDDDGKVRDWGFNV